MTRYEIYAEVWYCQCDGSFGELAIHPSDDGDWVKAEVAEKLLEENRQLRKRNDVLFGVLRAVSSSLQYGFDSLGGDTKI